MNFYERLYLILNLAREALEKEREQIEAKIGRLSEYRISDPTDRDLQASGGNDQHGQFRDKHSA